MGRVDGSFRQVTQRGWLAVWLASYMKGKLGTTTPARPRYILSIWLPPSPPARDGGKVIGQSRPGSVYPGVVWGPSIAQKGKQGARPWRWDGRMDGWFSPSLVAVFLVRTVTLTAATGNAGKAACC